ncbi:MAG TPA: hypothetical protein IAA20_05960 [Candidatus Enterococcus avicola]|uniref:Uncharacterized protein n=1 Tax=Candidatus Enterococcus avicola TaxID=2838561 RepID=A0A9D2F7P2_9ENTE|nr:hypothetical protein [Candidatus Enterococcus avicola]
MKISEFIHPIEQFSKLGSVHSVFPYSFNLQVGKQLINVSSFFEYLVSYGLYLPQNIFEEVHRMYNAVILSKLAIKNLFL